MSLILQVNNNSGGGGAVNPPSQGVVPSSTGSTPVVLGGHHPSSRGPITLAKPPVQVAIATAVKHHHPLLEHHHLAPAATTTTTLRMPMTLPQSPVRAAALPLAGNHVRHLPTTPLPPSMQRALRGIPKQINQQHPNPTHCIMVNPTAPTNRPAHHLTMLPQPANASGLLSTTVGLIPIPRVQLQPNMSMATLAAAAASHVPTAPLPHPNTSSASSSIILPPNTLHHQLFPPSKNRDDSSDELDVAEPPPEFLSRNKRTHSPKSRSKNQPMALQDHNYASRPISPPTPPPPVPQVPPPQSSIVLQNQSKPMPSNLESEDRHFQSGKSFNPAAPPEFLGHDETVASSTTVCSSSGSSNHRPPPTSPVVVSRTQANLNSIQEAGVGPMAPLVEDDSASLSSGGDDKGEETETAPEAEEAEDDSITRCICDFLHDDGYMICCDKCSVWQHVVCMGLDRNNIPDEYLCEVCKPRQIDRKRAKSLQARRRTEIFKNSSSSDDEHHNENKNSLSNKRALTKKLEVNKKNVVGGGSSNESGKVSLKRQKLKKTSSSSAEKDLLSNNKTNATNTTTPASKKNYRKKKNSSASSLHNNNSIKKITTRRRVNSSYPDDGEDDEDDEDEEDFDTDDLEPKFETGQQLRSWIDQYEEAVTNHYSPELRARLSGHKNGSGELRSSAINGPTRCTVSLQGNGIKILTANSNLSSNTPVIECKGRIMLASQFRASNKDQDYCNSPYVLFYRLSEFLGIVVDGKTYGNDSRFCRRSSTNHNAELKHVVDKGSLHIFIVTTKSLEKYQEILLPAEVRRLPRHNGGSISSSIQDDVREIRGKPSIRSSSSLLREDDDDDHGKENERRESPHSSPPPSSRDRRKKRNSEQRSARKTFTRSKVTRTRRNSNNKPSNKIDVTAHHEDADEEVEDESTPPIKVGNGEMGITPTEVVEDDDEATSGSKQDEDSINHNSVSSLSSVSPPGKSQHPSKTSPNKLGLPDNSRLIVGVNTINYDASSSLRNKSKSREERKMEMIMKAIEAMEKAEQRKKENVSLECGGGNNNNGGSGLEKPAVKRRRSSSVKMNAGDSNLELSSADESKSSENQHPNNKKMKKKVGRKIVTNAASPQRRRSRALSGGCSADENPSSSSSDNNHQFRFPKTKKMIVSDWLNQEEEDDDVSSNYLRGSRSPPGIATHLLRSAPLSPVKTVCSAKKRWLRQAISEDHTEESPSSGVKVKQEEDEKKVPPVVPSAADVVSDSVTPLKKRRLANYKEESSHTTTKEQEEPYAKVPPVPSPEEEDHPHQKSKTKEENLPSEEESKVPSALKKKLLQNLVLEAVLDSAMEDMLSNVTAATPSKEEESEVVAEEKHPSLEVKSEKPEEEDSDKKSPEDMPSPPGEVKIEVKEEEEQSVPPGSIKTPEPSSAFKSFFKSNVSLEDLEAELEASRRQRESTLVKEEEQESAVLPKTEDRDEENKKPSPPPSITNEMKEAASTTPLTSSSKPKEKKRVSLADYKRRRRQGSTTQNESSPTTPKDASVAPPLLQISSSSTLPSVPGVSSTNLSSSSSLLMPPSNHEPVSDEPGTPTLDEDQPVTMPTLNTLPLFEKLEQLEKAQRENCKKKVSSSSIDMNASSNPAVNSERKREDLTERLKKEFGLVVEDNQEELKVVDGEESTPETSSPQIPLQPQVAHHTSSSSTTTTSSSSRFSSFTPTQYPSYPSNYPLPPYPASKTAAAPHPPPSVTAAPPLPGSNSHYHHSRRTSSSSSDYYSSSHSSSNNSSRSYYSSSSGGREGRYRDRDYRDHHHHNHHHRHSSSSHRSSSSRNYRSSYYP